MNKFDFIIDSDLGTSVSTLEKELTGLKWKIKDAYERETSEGKQEVVITASTPINFYSWGENIIFILQANGNHTIGEVKISSKQLFDWGNSKRRVVEIQNALNTINTRLEHIK